jgi:hypothetical protein
VTGRGAGPTGRYAARHRLPVPRLARWLLALGIVATLAANVAHGLSHGPVGAAVAAWPAASLVGSYELLLWLIRTSGRLATVSSADGVGYSANPQTGPRLVAVAGTDGSERRQRERRQRRGVPRRGPRLRN